MVAGRGSVVAETIVSRQRADANSALMKIGGLVMARTIESLQRSRHQSSALGSIASRVK